MSDSGLMPDDRNPGLASLPSSTQARIAEARARYAELLASGPGEPRPQQALEVAPGTRLVDLVDHARRRIVWVVLVVLLGGAVGGYAGTLVDPRYESTAVLRVLDDRVRTGVLGDAIPPAGASAPEVSGLVESTDVLARAALDPASAVEISSTSDETGSVTITVHGPSPAVVHEAAVRIVHATVEVQRGRVAASLEALVAELDRRAAELRTEIDAVVAELAGLRATLVTLVDPAPAAEAAALTEQADALALRRDGLIDEERDVARRSSELAIEAQLGDGALREVVPASEAVEVTRPAPWHLAVLGAGVALLLAFGVLYVQGALDAARRN